MSLPRAVAAATTAGLAVLAVTPAAGARISSEVTFRSIGPVHLGETPSEVRARLGKPSFHSTAFGKRGPRVGGYAYGRLHLSMLFDADRAGDPLDLISVTGGAFHTSEHIGIGTSRATVKRRLAHNKTLFCTSDGCAIYPHSRSDDQDLEFEFKHGKVSEIEIQDHIDGD